MVAYNPNPRRVARSWAGQGTCETVYQDQDGNTYRKITEAEAQEIERSTGGQTFRIYRDGTIR